jgi:hypothetical protein
VEAGGRRDRRGAVTQARARVGRGAWLAVVAAGALGVGALATCNTRGPESAGGSVGVAGGKAVVAAMRAAERERAPWRCGRLRAAATPPVTADAFDVGSRRWTVEGDTLRTDERLDGLRIGVVADAHGDGVRAAMTRLGVVFGHQRVDLVATVGGMGTSEDDLALSLEPLTRGPWPVIAIPGDREAWPALRRAVARLRATGAGIVDGATVRFVEAGGVVVATLPGMPFRERLAADADGCGHDGADVAALLEALAARAGKAATALLTPRAPRTSGDGSDLATGGVHAGDVALTRALTAAPVDAVIHGQVADRAARPGRIAKGPVVVPAGSADLAPRFDEVGLRVPAQAMIVTLDRRGGVAWQPLPVAPGN